MPALRRPRLWFTLVAAWLAALFWLSSQPSLKPPGPDFRHKDKMLHAGYFALGGFLFLRGLRLRGPGQTAAAAAILTIAFCSTVGALDEWHQSFVPNRSGNDLWDWLADTAGGALGALAGWRSTRALPQSESC